MFNFVGFCTCIKGVMFHNWLLSLNIILPKFMICVCVCMYFINFHIVLYYIILYFVI